MITFSDWLKIRESSPATRIKTQAALGLAPPVADIFSRATPPPWQVKRLKKALKKSHKKKKRMVAEASKPQPINKAMDSFIAAIESLAKDLWELRRLKKAKGIKDTKEKIKNIQDAKEKVKDVLKKADKSQEKKDLKSKEKTDQDLKAKKPIDNKLKKDDVKTIKKMNKSKSVD